MQIDLADVEAELGDVLAVIDVVDTGDEDLAERVGVVGAGAAGVVTVL